MATKARGGEEMKRAAYGVLNLLKDNIPNKGILSIEREDDLVIASLKRHDTHLSTHTISQDHVDPFKLLCWLGCEIIHGLDDVSLYQHGEVLHSLINSLEEALMLETNSKLSLDKNDREILHRFMMEEIRGNGDHGIGFNGLFVAFHCFRSAYKQMQPE